MAELQAFLEIDSQIETHLVLSTTTKYKDALDIVRKFSVCSPQKFLFTKVDEASNVGTIINLVCQFPTTLSYITNGQNVPDDIELADPQKLANLILRD
ncbi:Flagellar biosynthesis protein FlhF [bioreactor metagenome]|uniref:Flagellar biosynthesis protein FlhF n=1 Tax=bioreactor metagenome TaxID=1076179 RepID=A0A645HYZ3_9ZZZZ